MAAMAVRDLLDGPRFRESLAEAEVAGAIPEEVYDECARRGLFALGVPEDHGGLAMLLAERLRLHADIARLSGSLHSVLIVHEMAVHAIARFASAPVRARWLEPMAGGRPAGAFALTEPAGGSRFEQIRTTATPGPDGLRLDGVKCWVSSARRAGVLVTFARAQDGVAAFVVAGDAPGLTVSSSPPLQACGASAMGDVRFDGCTVAPEEQLGADGLAAMRIATSCLTVGRVLVAVGALAVASAALGALAEHADRRVVGTTVLASHEIAQKAAADAYVRLRAGQLLARQAAAAADARDHDAPRLAIVAKLAATEAAEVATGHSVAFAGAGGLTSGSPLRRLAAEAAVYRTIEGPTEALTAALGADVLRRASRLDDALGDAPEDEP